MRHLADLVYLKWQLGFEVISFTNDQLFPDAPAVAESFAHINWQLSCVHVSRL